MYDHGKKKYIRDDVRTPLAPAEEPKKEEPAAAVAEEERRGADRRPFIAPADVFDLDSGQRFSTRTTDLGPGGCFVDTLAPLPVDSRVKITIRKGRTPLDTLGTVMYSQGGLGMGIAFDVLPPEGQRVLDEWLGSAPVEYRGLEAAQRKKRPIEGSQDRGALVRLVELLVRKRLITSAEASSIFDDLLL
jgi:PilZ domain